MLLLLHKCAARVLCVAEFWLKKEGGQGAPRKGFLVDAVDAAVGEKLPQRFPKPFGVAREDRIACQSAGFQARIGNVADELGGIRALQAKRRFYRRFHRVLSRYLQQHDIKAVPIRINAGIVAYEINRKPLLLEQLVN